MLSITGGPMLIADTSAWIEWFRGRGSPADHAFHAAFTADEVLLPEPVLAELMVGAQSSFEAKRMRRLFESVERVLIAPRDDFEAGIDLFFKGRAAGTTARGLLDCVIVATAARLGVPVLHHDRDFARLAPLAGVSQAPGSLDK
jgi:predicted nucleic acid-binding protein